MSGGRLSEFGEDIALTKDLVIDAVDFDLAPTVFAEDDFVANSDAECGADAIVEQFAGSDRDDLATLWLFFRAIWQDDTTGGGQLGFGRLDYDTIIEWTNIDFGLWIYL